MKTITFKDSMSAINYRITEGSEYGWDCYGQSVYQLDSWNGKHQGEGGTSINIVFDTITQVVYEMQAWDYDADIAYRWIHPNYLEAVKKEYVNRGILFKQAADIEFTDLEVVEDMLEKAAAISSGKEYDKRIQIELTLSDAEKFVLMELAHEKDMSLNQLVEYVLQLEIDRLAKKE